MSERRNTGAIARLPQSQREQVCLWMDDGHPDRVVVEKLAAIGVEVSEDSVQRWRAGADSTGRSGYVRWKHEQASEKRTERAREFAVKLAEKGSVELAQGLVALQATQALEIISAFDIDLLLASLADKPERYMDFVRSFAPVLGQLRLADEYRRRIEDASKAIAEAKRDGATDNDRLEVLRRVDEILGVVKPAEVKG